MQELINTAWPIMLIVSLVLAIAHIGLHKKDVKFTLPLNVLPLSIVTGIVFWLPVYIFNPDVDIWTLLLPYVLGFVLSLIIQTLEPKAEIFMASLCFILFLLFYKVSPDIFLLVIKFFSLGLVAGIVLRLLRAEKFLGNLLVTTSIVLPLYSGFTWLYTLNLASNELDKRQLLILIVTIIALAYAFTLTFLKDDKFGLKRLGLLIITTLVLFIVLVNLLNLPISYLYLIVAGFGLAQVLEGLNSNEKADNKSMTLDAITGSGLILLAGFILTRLFGVWGLIIVSLCCVATVSSKSERLLNWPVIASLFFSVKAMVHIFIEQTTLNVTGLNLNHPYVYVGLMVGLILPFVVLVLKLTIKEKFVGFNFFALFIFGFVTPLMAMYLIHCEASGALILGLSVTALIFAVAGKIAGKVADNKSFKIIANSMLPLAGLISLLMLSTQDIIEIGNIATRQDRAIVFVAVALVMIIFTISLYKVKDHTTEEFYPEQ